MTTYIYHLIDPLTREVRYIGKSTNPYRRLLGHMAACGSCVDESAKWMKQLRDAGAWPSVRIVDATDGEWKKLERKHITAGVRIGLCLLNTVCRGEKREAPQVKLRRRLLAENY